MRKNILKWWSGLQQNQSRQAARDAWRASFNVTDETQWAVYMNGVRAGHVTEQMIRRIEHLLQDDKRLRYWHLGRVGEGLSTVLNVMSELVRFLAVGFATVSGLVVFAALCSSTEVARWLQLAAAQPADTARTLSTAATGISLVMMAATIAYLMGRINEASPDPDPYRDAWIDRVRIAAQIVTLGALSCELPVANGRLIRLPHGGVFLRRGNEVLHGMGDA
ncbi:TPA: hypothetical protein QDC27_002669 [Burkholderia cepacia ATCC 25416]|jgi:hypothetical protein|uniref:Uncharacterized protein n=5 Tax=Pseudomonadota TaxID=1224 RepID=A0AAP4RA17_9BURK|nr:MULTISPECIES: hypothetical protein [Burkholderia]EJH9638377.1 hypothetical protein [Listeria monocytogenes]HDR9767744.1 hypothetical protein [Burkholderia cepacia ATCC 25416]ELK7725298.1 hypothetical protein [Burkholderia cenocepacia]MBA9834249.1 hypothetical protein [Burkholderia contaminans]MBD1415172.1 hypothetical protein [Burkholderia contaminans]